jgi:hypothetical protein
MSEPNGATRPRIIAVGEEPPPMDGPAPSSRADRGKPKGKPDGGKAKARERFGVLNAFIDFTMAELKPSERAVWLVLFRDTKRDGIARTSERDIARRAGVSDRMVRYALKALERRGLVRIVRRGRLQTGPSSYRVFGLERGRT